MTPTSPSFTHAMTLQRATDGSDGSGGPVFTGDLSPHWTIGPKIHGGVMLSLCAKAAHQAVTGDTGTAEPIAVSANFLWAPDPGPVELVTAVRKRGRQVSLVDVELRQGVGDTKRTAVRAAITLGTPEHHVPPLLSVNPVQGMSVEPPPEVEPIGPGHPLAEINHLAAGCDIRPDLSGLRSDRGEAPTSRIWVRPRDEAPDALFALTCSDISMPVTFAVQRRGWAPTVQLTAYLRGQPADGWLRVLCTTTQIGQDWFDEDHIVVDCEGRIVAQSRQLALVPAP
ncbi:thioesterase family protein [Mycolicibacterium komossense]|uniref:Thioesterase family protein n=1 Tax=Mycolicibacterium komossense TaxID=1779 RepID=A0ABT3CLH0_9MYCO|nr:thioesterase family protein [Mycolicibacterium komossense]